MMLDPIRYIFLCTKSQRHRYVYSVCSVYRQILLVPSFFRHSKKSHRHAIFNVEEPVQHSSQPCKVTQSNHAHGQCCGPHPCSACGLPRCRTRCQLRRADTRTPGRYNPIQFVRSLDTGPHIEEIHQKERWLNTPLALALLPVQSQGPCCVRLRGIRRRDVANIRSAEERLLLIFEVIRKTHVSRRYRCCRGAHCGRAVECAIEAGEGDDVVRSLEDVSKFGEEVWVVAVIVDACNECYKACVRRNERLEGRPVGNWAGSRLGCVSVGRYTGRQEHRAVCCSRFVVGVDK